SLSHYLLRKKKKKKKNRARQTPALSPSSLANSRSKVSWARSLSVSSSNLDSNRRSEFDSDSKEFSDSIGVYEFLSLCRANDLRVSTFSELKSATRGFSMALLFGEGGFGCVYGGVVKVSGSDVEIDDRTTTKMPFPCPWHKERINEVNFLCVVKHPNLVKLVGYCATFGLQAKNTMRQPVPPLSFSLYVGIDSSWRLA
ncbi:hypothetical protein F8388_002347, partial [Cannabis sativa]